MGKGKSQEAETSNEDEHPKHRRRSWSKIVKALLIDETVSSNNIDSNATYTGNHVPRLLKCVAKNGKTQVALEGKGEEGWKEVKSKSATKKERVANGEASMALICKRKHLPDNTILTEHQRVLDMQQTWLLYR